MSLAAPTAETTERVEVLRRLCHAFASISDPEQAVSATIGWVEAALGGSPASVCIALPDPSGRLRLAGAKGRRMQEGRLRSRRRRRAFTSKRPVRIELPGRPARSLHIFPLVSRGEPVGVVEVAAASSVIEDRMDVLEAVLGQAAAVLRNARIRAESDRALAGLEAGVGLAADLIAASSPARAVRLATDLCFEHLRVPVVGWLPVGSTSHVVVNGFGAARRGQVRREIAAFAELPPAKALRGATTMLAPFLGSKPVVVRAGDAVLLGAGGIGEPGTALLETVGRLLADALRTIGSVTEARAKSDGLNLGIALTAHELQAPLIGVVTALDRVVSMDGDGPSTALVRRSREELANLAGLVDPLLRWAAGPGRLNTRAIDLVEVVRDAIGSCELQGRADRIVLCAPRTLELTGDPKLLGIAIANLVRNARDCSPPAEPVNVDVGATDGSAWVSVMDRGPGVSADERDVIFDPFARGRAGVRARRGAGLGLFITRRVAEAHGGAVRLLPTIRGASFCLELPIHDRAVHAGRRVTRSAS